MKKENIIVEVSALIYKNWSEKELKKFYERAKKIYIDGEKNIAKALRAACYENNIKTNEIYIDVPFIQAHEILAQHCLDDFSSFLKLVNLGMFNISKNNLREYESITNFKESSKNEMYFADIYHSSQDMQREILASVISSYTVFEDLSKAGISIDEMLVNEEFRNIIGTALHTEWLKRNSETLNRNLKIPFSKLDSQTKKQYLIIFDNLIRFIRDNNIKTDKNYSNLPMPDYSLKEKNVLLDLNKMNIKLEDDPSIIGLFVMCKIMDHYEVEEEWWQYDTLGRMSHSISVFPIRYLVYAKLDEQGDFAFYDANTHERIKEFYSDNELYSHDTQSYCNLPVGHSSVCSYNGLLTPLEDFYQQKFGKKLEIKTLKEAKMKLRLANSFINRPIFLSRSPEKAKEQLEQIGYFVSEEPKSKSL